MDTTRPVMADELSAGDLLLRVFESRDLYALHAIFSDPLTHTVGGGPFTSLDQTRTWLENRRARRRQHGVAWYGLWRPDGTLVGNSGLFIGRTGNEPEFGFEVSFHHQGKGYGTLAAQAAIHEAHRAGFARLWATVRPSNAASLTVMRRIGFRAHHADQDMKGELLYFNHDEDFECQVPAHHPASELS